MSTEIKAPRWDLDSIFPGGSESEEYAAFRADIKNDLKKASEDIKNLPEKLDDSSRVKWIQYFRQIQELAARVDQAGSFVGCLVSQNTDDTKAQQIYGEIDVFDSELRKILVSLEAFAMNQTDDEWKKLIESDELKEVQFYLNEMRDIARKKMKPEYEALAAELAVNGYHAWNRLYDKIYGDLRGDFTENGKKVKMSLGQLANKMTSPDRAVRKQAHDKIEELWESRSNEASMALNFQAGFRLALYDRRKWNSVLIEPLLNSRIKEDTLNAMWNAVSNSGKKIHRYIEAKKKILSIDKFRWYDQFAPVGASDKKYSFGEAGDLIVAKIGEFSKSQAELTRTALDKRWVEAEDRPGKAGGAFCTDFLCAKQSRVFMTYEGSLDNVATLAHELGHAYHQNVVINLPPFATHYPMTLAETASIFNEFLVLDAMLQSATEQDEKLLLLDLRLQNAYILFCNLFARYLFDCRFYEERKNGLVAKKRLDELMVEAQKEAFFGTLADDGYHSLFWASKLHFFLTRSPFYNFPYTFGYLFASGVYNRAKTEGPSFADNYEALLADTGKMSSEDIARKHMGVDLTKGDFWNEAVKRSLADVEPFEQLVDEAMK